MPKRPPKPPIARIELLQGTLDLIVLQALRWGPRHGYGLVQLIRATSNGVLQVDAGSLYPALHRLEKQRFVKAGWETSDNNQRVRVYRLTPAGRRRLTAERSRFEQFTQAIAGLFVPPTVEDAEG
ncbi:MAG TPA: PadR family transcriptional regulator [Gemmatimonadaceae bacterium]|jgi:transcriptional regulator|nr:PadR family transcriptional regulator [Gemmatimonadaceae bacterium]